MTLFVLLSGFGLLDLLLYLALPNNSLKKHKWYHALMPCSGFYFWYKYHFTAKQTIHLIVGPQEYVRSTYARAIGNNYKPIDTCYYVYSIRIYGDPFFFSLCDVNTKLIIFDALKRLDQLDYLINFISKPIQINRTGYKYFFIEPDFVITMQTALTKQEILKLAKTPGIKITVL